MQPRNSLLWGLAPILVVCLTGVPALAQKAGVKTAGGRPTGCIASSIGQRFELKTIGLMVFGNDLKTTSVATWGIDGLVVQRLAAGLGSK